MADKERKMEWSNITLNKAIKDIIQWSPKKGGIVRVKVEKNAQWHERKCETAFFAKSLGETLIREQRGIKIW